MRKCSPNSYCRIPVLRTLFYFIFVLKNGGKADPSKCKKSVEICASYLHFFGYFFKAIEDCADSQLFRTVVRPIMCSWCTSTGTGVAHPSSLLFCLKAQKRNWFLSVSSPVLRIRIGDTGSGTFSTPGSGMDKKIGFGIPDPGWKIRIVFPRA